jgi:hypothetical protein
MSARSRDVLRMITIGSVGSAPINVKYTVTGGVYLFFLFYSSGPLEPNDNSHPDHYASIDADFHKVVSFGGVEICKENFRVIFALRNCKKKCSPLYDQESLEQLLKGNI